MNKKNHFIFQQYKESEDAQRYMTFYPVNEWPYVSILDPRTGELLVTRNKLEASTFCDLVTEFLTLHPSLADEKTTSKPNDDKDEPPNKKSKTTASILDADEDDQLAAAIQASLAESTKQTKKTVENSDSELSDEDNDDDDSYFDNVESFSAEISRENSNAAFTNNSQNKGSSSTNNGKESLKKDKGTSKKAFLKDLQKIQRVHIFLPFFQTILLILMIGKVI